MAPMKTQILCKKLIKPSTPTSRHLRPVKLSLMDQLIPPTDINMIFYYSPNDEDKIAKSKERCSQLEKSLAEALTKFYPLAGRLVMDDLLIDCNDEGVEFLKARSNGNLADFLHGGPHAELLDQLVPGDGGVGDSATAPLAAIQLNVFDCGGVVVGVSISHKVADAFSIIKFVNGWATANRDGIKGVICPNFNLGSIFPTLVAAAGGSAPRPPTGVEVVAALIWKALIGIAQVKHGHLRASLLVHPLNLRGHTAISIPDNSFGNFSMLFIERLVEERKLEFHELVSLLGNSKRDVDPGKTGSVDDLCSMVNGSFREARREKLHNHRVDVHLCASWCGLPLYEADFGWGKPIWVSSSSKYEVVKLIENKCGDGIDAWVSLNEKDMLEFERDLDILAFTSQ
ncbi:hypothetical protein Acr_06g0013580 [Actinidia rufa]|uniref:HXXXD-type acyl-transferase family protein n=1 Tax=Actinidia rufa TaxID=165716 RepID=A0A7J0ESG9_9ERIC|nr:hypothetical protein Acr_06g0013580 [Actinidia rufa]